MIPATAVIPRGSSSAREAADGILGLYRKRACCAHKGCTIFRLAERFPHQDQLLLVVAFCLCYIVCGVVGIRFSQQTVILSCAPSSAYTPVTISCTP